MNQQTADATPVIYLRVPIPTYTKEQVLDMIARYSELEWWEIPILDREWWKNICRVMEGY